MDCVIDANNNSLYNHHGSKALTASPLPCLLGSIAERGRLQPYMQCARNLKYMQQQSASCKKSEALGMHAYAKVVSPPSLRVTYNTKGRCNG